MTVTSDALPPPIDLATWDAWEPSSDHTELVRGLVTTAPSESPVNSRGAALLCALVEAATGREFSAYPHTDVVLADVPATVRCPDVVVAARGRLTGSVRAWAADVALVAEIVSPSSVETDWIAKRAEYARAGIPAYLVADLRPDTARIALFTEPGPTGYARATGGSEVVVTLDAATFAVRRADLTDPEENSPRRLDK